MTYVPVQHDGHSGAKVWHMYRYSTMVTQERKCGLCTVHGFRVHGFRVQGCKGQGLQGAELQGAGVQGAGVQGAGVQAAGVQAAGLQGSPYVPCVSPGCRRVT